MWITNTVLTKTTPHLTMLNMATLLQKKLAQNIVNAAKSKKRVNKKDLLVSAGYSEVTATATPGLILEQKGVKKELKALGFNEDKAKKVVAEILDDKYQDGAVRIAAAREVFKVFGTYAAEKSVNMNVSASVDEVRDAISKTLSRFREIQQ
jgi:hypothetical protein